MSAGGGSRFSWLRAKTALGREISRLQRETVRKKKNLPLTPPSRLEDRRQGGESEEERFQADTGQCTYDPALGDPRRARLKTGANESFG